jgi:hypothetical protein
MEIIPQLIRDYSVVLYAVCGIACAYFVFAGVASLRELKRAVFRLERSAVMSRAIGAWLKALLCVLAAAAIFLVSSISPARTAGSLLDNATVTPGSLVPPTSVPTAEISAQQIAQAAAITDDLALSAVPPVSITVVFAAAVTATPGETATPAADSTSPAPAPTPAPTLAPTTEPLPSPEITPSPTPTPEPTPTAQAAGGAAVIAVDCSSPEAQLISPAAGETVAGGIRAIRGTALVEGGGFYKLEILMPNTGVWSFVGRGEAPVQNGDLVAAFNFAELAPGNYPLRLVIIRPDSNIGAMCLISFAVGQ